MDGAGNNPLRDLPKLADPPTAAAWRAHLKTFELTCLVRGIADVAANQNLKRTLMFLSLGEKGQQRAYHLSPDVRPAAETFAEYVEALSALFVPAQESDMAKVDFKKCKQGKKEPIQTFHARKVRLFMDAFGVNPMNVGDHMDVFFDSYLESVYRKEVKADLLEHRPYERPEDVLNRALTSCAKHRMLAPEGVGASALDGLHSAIATNSVAGTSGAAGAAGGQPMELGAIQQEQQENYRVVNCEDGLEEDLETVLASMSTMETPADYDYWEDTTSQFISSIVQGTNGAATATKLCFSCHRPGHLKRDCWMRPKNAEMAARNRVRGQQNGRGRGRGRGSFSRPLPARPSVPPRAGLSGPYRRTVDTLNQHSRNQFLAALQEVDGQQHFLSRTEGNIVNADSDETPGAAAREEANFNQNF